MIQNTARFLSSKDTSDDFTFALTAASAMFALGAVAVVACENTPSGVDHDDIKDAPISLDYLPEYTSEQVAKNNGEDGTPVWMSYGGIVYDVTNFIANHPGGSEKIMQAAGSVSEMRRP
jgi:cytochrome b involved in lipid metabolism